jgi:hypothetical protein
MHETMPMQLGGARLDRLRHVCGLFKQENPFYLPPDQLLGELHMHTRGSRPASLAHAARG